MALGRLLAGLASLATRHRPRHQACRGAQAEHGSVRVGIEVVDAHQMRADGSEPAAACVTLDLAAGHRQHAEPSEDRPVPGAEGRELVAGVILVTAPALPTTHVTPVTGVAVAWPGGTAGPTSSPLLAPLKAAASARIDSGAGVLTWLLPPRSTPRRRLLALPARLLPMDHRCDRVQTPVTTTSTLTRIAS
jgi:hypothetical protein